MSEPRISYRHEASQGMPLDAPVRRRVGVPGADPLAKGSPETHGVRRGLSPSYEIVIVAYKSRAPIQLLLSRLPRAIPVVVIDNSREAEDLADVVSARPGTRYLDSGGNLGFGGACNLGAKLATRPYLVFLNPDTHPEPDLFSRLVQEIEGDPACSSCAPALVDEDGAAQLGAGGWQPTLLRAVVHATGLDRLLAGSGIWFRSGAETALDLEWLAGTYLAIRRDVFLSIGGFDSRYFLYQEDMDLGRRLRDAGYRQVLRADLRLSHVKGGSSTADQADRLWKLRGQMLAQYLGLHNPPVRACILRAVLGAGFLVRAAIFRMLMKRRRATEMWSYARMLFAWR